MHLNLRRSPARAFAARAAWKVAPDLNGLLEAVEEHRGRKVLVIDRPDLVGTGVYANVVSLRSVDVIGIRTDLGGWHRALSICHECGHLIAGHTAEIDIEVGGLVEASPGAAARILGLVPTLNRECSYAGRQEREAEAFARRIMRRVGRRVEINIDDPQTQRVVRNLSDLLS